MAGACAPSRGRGSRRGTILLVVLVVIAIAALTGTTAMYLGEAGVSAEAVSIKRVQTRALAWSGVQAAMAELADQREALLDGAAPELTESWDLFTDASGVRGVVRLRAIGTAGVAASETAKLDVNSATAEMLGRVKGLTPELASAIVAARASRPFSSVQDLLRVPGITPEMLVGTAASGPDEPRSGGSRSAGDGLGPAVRLADLLTVFSFDPNVQAGLGEAGAEHRGNLRLNLDTPWSDRLGQAIDARFGEGASRAVKGLMDGGAKFKTLADVVAAARSGGLEPKAWGEVLDVFTVTDDPFLLGRVDVNLAPVEVLTAIPGISLEAAEKMAAARAGLDEQARRSVVWPLTEGFITADDFAKAVDRITTRSTQWRVRVEAGYMLPSADGVAGRTDEAPLADRMVLEAVIDVASERPRVAYLRDVTLEEIATALGDSLAARAAESAQREPDEGAEGPTDSEAAPAEKQDPAAGAGAAPGSANKSANGNLGDRNTGGPIQEREPRVGSPEGPPAPAAEPVERTGVDRRLGRWTTGKGRTGAGR